MSLEHVVDGSGQPRKPADRGEEITRDDINRVFREACWDTWIANLPDPTVIDAQNPDANKDVPPEYQEHVMRGFAFDARTSKTYFNVADIPAALRTRREKARYARSIFHHEVGGHYGIIPGDIVTEACLIDAAMKGFKDPSILTNPAKARQYSHTVMNLESDLILDTYLAKEGYGREDLGELTLWRQRTTIQDAIKAVQEPSAIWQIFVRTHEKFWQEDLGVNKIVPAMKPEYERAADELAAILGRDWKDRDTWEDKAREFARVLEPYLKQSIKESKQGKGMKNNKPAGGDGQLPDDLRGQMGGNPDRSQVRKDEPKEDDAGGKDASPANGSQDGNGPPGIDERVLEEIYKRNKNDPGRFAGTMAALEGLEPDEALKLMYRARAQEFRMRIAEREHQRSQTRPGYRTTWQLGDPVLGKGGLDIITSMLNSGKPIPNITTSKRRLERSKRQGSLSMTPDLLLVIDSSGSMSWKPYAQNPEDRGDFDKAIIAGESAALEAIANGGRVAVINFSGPGNVTYQDYTGNIDKIECALMKNYSGGTTVPYELVTDYIRRTSNPLQVCLMSDCDISNPDKAAEAFSHATREPDELAIFRIGNSGQTFVEQMRAAGAAIHDIVQMNDLAGIVLGAVRQRYNRRKQQ